MVKLIIDVPEVYYKFVIKHCKEPCLLNAFRNGKLLPKDATNGDLIKSMFPDVEIEERKSAVYMKDTDGVISSFGDTDWWNEPYKGGIKDADSN